jgi:hypothetical protein
MKPGKQELRRIFGGTARNLNFSEKEGDSESQSNVNYLVYPNRSEMVLYSAAALSLIAALIHLWVMPEHFEEWWGYGTFFLFFAIVQGFYGVALLRWPRRPLLLLGIGGNLLIIVLYLLTRTVGIPFFGPDVGEVEGIGLIDLCATTSELALIVALGALLLGGLPRERVVMILLILGLAVLFLGHLLHLAFSGS